MTPRLVLAFVLALIFAAPARAQAPSAAPQLGAVTHTAYSKNTELFAEWRPLIVGEATRLTAHLTRTGNEVLQTLRRRQSDTDVDRRRRCCERGSRRPRAAGRLQAERDADKNGYGGAS
jgi:hypothetical protein